MANIFDVAAAAQVSHQTVSRVLHDAASVRPATRARVEAAIAQLHYRPSAAARALASRRTRTLGLITVGMPLFGPSSITHGFNAAARRAGWDVSIAALEQSGAADVRHAADALLGQNVQAVVVVAPSPSVSAGLDGLADQVPVVTTVHEGIEGAVTVAIDHAAGAALAVHHLARLGHPGVLHLAGPADWAEAEERERGWRAESQRIGLAVAEPLRGDWTAADGHRIGRAIAAEGAPSAIFSANDQMALGLLAAFAEAGVRVPGDVSVVGFDDIPEARFFGPPLTTVRQDFAALGQRLMARVEDTLGERRYSGPQLLQPELIVRASTAVAATARA